MSRDIGSNLREFKSTALEIRNSWSQTLGNPYKAFNDDIQKRRLTFSPSGDTYHQFINVDAVNRTIPAWFKKIFDNVMIILNNQRAEDVYQNLQALWSRLDSELVMVVQSPPLTLDTFAEYYQQRFSIPISKINECCDIIEQEFRRFRENVKSDLEMLSRIARIADIYPGTVFGQNFRKGIEEIKSMFEELKNYVDLILKMTNKIKKMIAKSLQAYFDYVRQKISEGDEQSAIKYLSKIERMLRVYRMRFLSP